MLYYIILYHIILYYILYYIYVLLKSWCCWLCEFDRVVVPLHFHECGFAQQFQKNREKWYWTSFSLINMLGLSENGYSKNRILQFFLNIWWPFIWGGHPPCISLVISPVYPWLRGIFGWCSVTGNVKP